MEGEKEWFRGMHSEVDHVFLEVHPGPSSYILLSLLVSVYGASKIKAFHFNPFLDPSPNALAQQALRDFCGSLEVEIYEMGLALPAHQMEQTLCYQTSCEIVMTSEAQRFLHGSLKTSLMKAAGLSLGGSMLLFFPNRGYEDIEFTRGGPVGLQGFFPLMGMPEERCFEMVREIQAENPVCYPDRMVSVPDNPALLEAHRWLLETMEDPHNDWTEMEDRIEALPDSEIKQMVVCLWKSMTED